MERVEEKKGKQAVPNSSVGILIPLTTKLKERYNFLHFTHVKSEAPSLSYTLSYTIFSFLYCYDTLLSLVTLVVSLFKM